MAWLAPACHPGSVYEQPGRRIGPALIAFLVVLAAAAGSVGYFGARQIIAANEPLGSRTSPPAGANPTQPTPGGTSTSTGNTPGNGPSSPTRTTPAQVPPGDSTKCPDATETAVIAGGLAGGLELLLYVQVRRTGQADAEIWVCRNTDDVLIYQGHVLSAALDVADNGQNTLLLAEGIKGSVATEGDGFLAVNPSGANTTEYHVSRTRLRTILKPAGRVTDYTVVKVYPP